MALQRLLPEGLEADRGSIFLVLAGFFVTYKVFIYVQRLYFHSLSKFPGPKICAASRVYEFYWESIQQGRLWAQLPNLHKQYGPIIRLGPNEVHIQDSEYFDTLFGFRPLNKDAIAAKQYGMNNALFGTEDYKMYTKKRAAFGDAFSKTKALKLVDLINEQTDKACELISKNADEGKGTDLAYIFRATPAEVITQYLFGEQYGFLEDEQTTKSLYDKRLDNLFGLTHLGRFIGPMPPLILSLLRQQLKKLLGFVEPGAAFMTYYFFAAKQVNKVVEAHKDPSKSALNDTYPIVFTDFLNSSLPESQKSGGPLTEQAMAVWSGGWDTVGSTLTVGAYFTLKERRILESLQAELKAVWPNAQSPLQTSKIDDLPYLGAIIKEALRFTPGQFIRLSRVNPTAPEQYKNWSIPPGTTISMSLTAVSHDPAIWGDDHDQFRPERWLEDNKGNLDRYLVAFSKGTRVCPGLELALLEMKLLLATLFRRFDMKIPEEAKLTDEDILPYYDAITFAPKTWMHRLPVVVERKR